MAQAETNAGGGKNSGGCGCIILLAILIAIPFALYEPLDNAGWIHHSHDTPVWIQGDWMNGEYRDCEMLTGYSPSNKAATSDIPKDYPRLFCGTRRDYELSDFLDAIPAKEESQAFDVIFSSPQEKEDVWTALNVYFHVLPIHYYGRIKRPDKWSVNWHCQRNNDSLTCNALD